MTRAEEPVLVTTLYASVLNSPDAGCPGDHGGVADERRAASLRIARSALFIAGTGAACGRSSSLASTSLLRIAGARQGEVERQRCPRPHRSAALGERVAGPRGSHGDGACRDRGQKKGAGGIGERRKRGPDDEHLGVRDRRALPISHVAGDPSGCRAGSDRSRGGGRQRDEENGNEPRHACGVHRVLQLQGDGFGRRCP